MSNNKEGKNLIAYCGLTVGIAPFTKGRLPIWQEISEKN